MSLPRSSPPQHLAAYRPASDGEPAPSPDARLVERCAWSLVWFVVIAGGLGLWGFWWSSAWDSVLGVVLVLVGIAGTVLTWRSATCRSRGMHLLALVGVILAVGVPQTVVVHTRHWYSTDSAAFDQVAAHALLQGKDPYTVSMAPAAGLLQGADRYWTYTATGGHVSAVSYPAGSFLLIVPAMAMGFRHQIVDWIDLVAWFVAGALLFFLLPVAVRWLALLVMSIPLLVALFSGGGTDAVFLPFLTVAVWRWDRYAKGPEAGVARWIGPVALGLACAIKQMPWFCVPFLAAGIAMEARRDGRRAGRVVVRYVATVVGVFAVVNLPFVVWSPAAWVRGTMTPFLQPLVADGQGLVALATHGVVRGADLTLLTVAGGLAYVSLLALFVGAYARLKRVWLLLLPVAFFFSARSLSSYLVDLFAAALLAAVSVADVPAGVSAVGRGHEARRPGPATVVALLGALGGLVFAALAFVGPPLRLSVVGSPVARHGAIDAVTVSVRNLTGGTVTPHFLVNMAGNPNGFWLPKGAGALHVGPHATATVTLYPPVWTGTPKRGTHWVVEAYTSARRLSTSSLQLWNP